MCRISIFTFLTFVSVLSFAQGDSTKINKVKVEILFNVSDALGRATGNVNSSTRFTDPIMLGAKLVLADGKKAVRFGANFDVTRGDEFGGNFERRSTNEFYTFSGGMEFRNKLSEKFEYFYGADLQYYREVSRAEISFIDNNGTFSTEQLNSVFNGPGASLLIGFRWNISKRIAFYTETNVAFQAINRYRYIADNLGNKSILEDKLEMNIRPVPPGAIFLTFTL
jgi:hypothetical protein